MVVVVRMFAVGVEAALQPVSSAERSLGAGPAQWLALLVVDDRAQWLEAAAFPAGTALHRCGRDYTADLPAISAEALCVVMTRCHETDIAVLEALTRRGTTTVATTLAMSPTPVGRPAPFTHRDARACTPAHPSTITHATAGRRNRRYHQSLKTVYGR